MRARSQVALAVLLLAAISLPLRARQETVNELKAKVPSTREPDQPKLCVEIAHLQLDATEKAYQAGQVTQAQTLLNEVVDYAQKAGDAARQSRKHIKKTEIEVRKISRRLQDLKPTVDLDSRQPVQDAINRLEHIRTQLLMQMFSEK
jgi:hypothetical protein